MRALMFLNIPLYGWKHSTITPDIKIHYKGDEDTVLNIANVISKEELDDKTIVKLIQRKKEFGSAVIETKDLIIAWVDHIRSYPIFYSQHNNCFILSQSADEISKKTQYHEFDEENLIEFKLSGYVTGNETLVKNIKCLQPGELLIWDKINKTLIIEKYFSYIPTYDSPIKEKEAVYQLGIILDNLTLEVIKRANKRQIAIPLSGGLDSRILLCKLHEHGYTNITTFTYGPRWNFEALAAKKIAKKLKIPWQFIHVPKKLAKNYFNSQEREDFWQFSSNLKTIPCSREYAAIRYIHENQLIDKNAIILNGQSGDYITGGHISEKALSKKDYNEKDLYEVIINKHYDLWQQYKTKENLSLIKNKIKKLIEVITQKQLTFDKPEIKAQNEEVWEYEGRQICYVVNGQRIYDYYGYDWEMPLWDKELVDFYSKIPLEMKQNQALYKIYLKAYNYKNLFPQKEKYIWRWPIPMLWVIPAAQIIGLINGKNAKKNFYAKMRYFGHYANQYQFFDWQDHKKTYKNARSIISLYIPDWLKKNKLPFKQ